MPNKNEILRTLKFTISCGSGDGAYISFKKVSKELRDYFIKKNLDLEEYALNFDYADRKKIPEKMQPFNSGDRASFGSYECGMTVGDDLELNVIDEKNSKEIFLGLIPKSNIEKYTNGSISLKKLEKGFYLVGYEGLEDCYITGSLKIKESFDIKKLKIKYINLDYEIAKSALISSITYDEEKVDWELDSYEGTGDNSFEFVEVE